ncbi:MAG TPA: NUDIX hydrolase [Candidatus Copromorpha excrementigallinarum]|uniref:NUDIX hydrolase n=1 Tax=Candidatus Allocopromorpha excrementigallinarum TaxID=2840742 RepID=A0A9D1HYS1_9FIRM|nr:NUDIX hydrolase [Candidatus Copromorpha excrementigallinarum]
MWIGGVRVIILDDTNRMLMVRQCHEGRDIWMVPGGAIEEGESSIDAAVREVKEETGLDVEIGNLIWHVEEVSDRGQRFVNFFLGRIKGGSLSLGEDPELEPGRQVLKEAKFMSRQELDEIQTLYPEYLKDEFWRFLREDYLGYNAFKIRNN